MHNNKIIHAFYVFIILIIIMYYSGFIFNVYGSFEDEDPAYIGPNTFGSVAVPTNRSPYNQKWYHSTRFGYGQIWDRMLSTISSNGSEKQKLQAAQRVVNHTITWGQDSVLWGQSDYWSSPNETLKKGSGDCEDSAILKMMLLRAAGFPRDNLYLVIGLDTAAKQPHAVLVAKSEGRFWVLDQRADGIVTDEAYGSFAPVISMNATQSWVHGYNLLGAWFTPTYRTDFPNITR